MSSGRVLAMAGTFLGCMAMLAQRLEFEVASVRPFGPPVPGKAEGIFIGGPGTPDPSRITASRITLVLALRSAYGVEVDQIFGPAWLDEERYDIAATLPPG